MFERLGSESHTVSQAAVHFKWKVWQNNIFKH